MLELIEWLKGLMLYCIDLAQKALQNNSWYYLVAILALYPMICSLLRYRRLHSTLGQFSDVTKERSLFCRMTDEQATLIQTSIGELEFPFIFEKALQFALFRTYGIPTISKLLSSTTELSSKETATKRYSDTSLLISEFVGHSPTSKRSREAIARMNYIHSIYLKSGKITNQDILYTLSLFACEPVRWINKYEWRELELFEVCAIGTFWKSLGDAMNIDYSILPKTEWKDGLEWWYDIKEWSTTYEEENMLPAESNQKTAEETVKILLWNIPTPLKSVGKNAVSALMDDRLRKAMMFTDPPALYPYIISIGFTLRKWILRYLSPPRPEIFRYHNMSSEATSDGRYFALKYDAAPYYIKPTIWQRYSFKAWYLSYLNLPIPGDEKDKFYPNGYKISEMGPKAFQGKGSVEMEKNLSDLEGIRMGGCPFTRS